MFNFLTRSLFSVFFICVSFGQSSSITPDVNTLLGFNTGFDVSKITVTPQTSGPTVKVCVFSHGFGDCSRNNTVSMENNILKISFDYYYSINKELTGGPGADIFHNALGQDFDVLTLLAIVINTYEKLRANGFLDTDIKFNLFAHSMGGAVVINVLEAVAFPNDHKNLWEKLGYKNADGSLKEHDIKDLANVINNVYLACPLMSLEKLIASKISNPSSYTSYLGDALGKMGKVALGLSNKKYSSLKGEPIDNLRKILMNSLHQPFKNMVVNLATIDNVVGNHCDHLLENMEAEYKTKNLPSLFKVNLGAEIGHNYTQTTIQQFKLAL